MPDADALRAISNRLLVHISDLQEVERQSRTVPIGSPELARLSARVTALSRDVARLAVEQEEVARLLAAQPTTIDAMDSGEVGDSGSPSR